MPGTSERWTWIVAAIACVLSIAILYPGQYPFDAAYQLWQARSGNFSNQSPVSMTALWSVLLEVTGDPASLLCLNLAMFWVGLALCVTVVARRSVVRVGLLLAFGLTPLVLVELAHVLTDAHLAALLVLATGLAGWGLERNRRAPLVACLLVLVYAGSIRHNAILAIVPYGAALVAKGAFGGRGVTRSAALGAVVLAAMSFAAGVALDRALTASRVTAWPMVALWDLAAVSVAANELLLPPFTRGPGLTVDELRRTGAFDPTTNTYLFQRTKSGMRDGLGEPFSASQLNQLRAAWMGAVLDHPVAYARHRARTFWLLVGPHEGELQGITHFVSRIQYRNNPPLPDALFPRVQRQFYAFVETLKGGWLFAALPYLLLGAIALAIGWLRPDRSAARLAIAISGSALLYTLGYLVLAPAADLRYLTWPLVAGPLALGFALSSRGVLKPAP